MIFKIFKDCNCKIEDVCNSNSSVNLVQLIPPNIAPVLEPITRGFNFSCAFDGVKITNILFPKNLWTGGGDTRDFGIWLASDTSTPLYTGTINKNLAEFNDDYYIFKLPTEFTIVKNVIYIYGALLITGDSYYSAYPTYPPYYGVFTDLFAFNSGDGLTCPLNIQQAAFFVSASSFSYNGVINLC